MFVAAGVAASDIVAVDVGVGVVIVLVHCWLFWLLSLLFFAVVPALTLLPVFEPLPAAVVIIAISC